VVPAVRDILSPNDNAKSDTIDFADGTIVYNNSATTHKDLQRISTRYVFGDELWQWPKGALQESMARTKAYEWTSKKLYASQPGLVGDDFANLYGTTDQREWQFKCPACSHMQPYDWAMVRFPDDAKTESGWDHRKVEDGTTYECAKCAARLPDTNETRIRCNAEGEFVPMTISQKRGWVGLHVNALASTSWGSLGVDMLKAKEASDTYGDEEPRRIFKQKYLALPWSDDGGTMVTAATASDYALADDWEAEAMITPKATLADKKDAPQGSVPFRTAGIDCQRGHFFGVVRSWSKTGHSRLRAFARLETWGDVENFTKVHNVHRALVVVDAGDNAQVVYAETAKRGWKCAKGSGQDDFTVKGRDGQTSKRFYSDVQSYVVPGQSNRARLIVWSNTAGKDLMAGLRARKVHSYARDTVADYVEQMSAEVRVRDSRTGKPQWILPAGKKDNHAFDCELLAMLMAVRWGIVGREGAGEAAPLDA
jgi:phage terminase large subunit GpA-like protein